MLRMICAVALLCAPLSAALLIGASGASPARAETGLASWYGAESGRRTASGERFEPAGMTCAMRTRAWRTVLVTVLATGRSAHCRVNDYGPAKRTGRLIDVSHGVATRLGFVRAGVVRVSVQ